MGERVPQTLKNHARFDPMFHFFLAPVAVAFLFWMMVHTMRHPSGESVALLVIAMLLFLILGLVRTYSLKVQDRVIRLEETLRLTQLTGNVPVPTLTVGQIVALRFASDAEMPSLANKAAAAGLKPKQIKEAIQSWRPDYFRV